MDVAGDDEADVAIDSGAGVPAGGGLGGVVAADGEGVGGGGAEVEVAGEFVAESDVAVGALAEVVAVDPDVAVGHDAVELDEDAAVGVGDGDGEVFAIPADTVGEVGSALSGRVGLGERAFDGPVVGDAEGAP